MNSIITSRELCLFLCLFFSVALLGQKPNEEVCPAKDGSLLINEVGNIAESKYGHNAGEFIELVVTGSDPTIPVNLEGFIIDDNYASKSSNGTTPGHIRLGSCFSDVMPGTIILMYDDLRPFPGIDPVNDGLPNTEGVYQIPFNNSCLIKVSNCPTYSSTSNYGCYNNSGIGTTATNTTVGNTSAETGISSSFDWRSFIHMNDAKDVVQVRNEKNQLVHVLMWWSVKGGGSDTQVLEGAKSLVYPDQNSLFAVKIYNGNVGGKSISFSEQDHLKKENYKVISSGPPRKYNYIC